MTTKIITGLLISILSLSTFAQDPQQLVADGNKAYSDGIYTDAVSLYTQVTELGYEREGVRSFFNLFPLMTLMT